MRGLRDAQVLLELAVDVAEAARQRADVRGDGERQPDRMPRRRVGVLADDQHAYGVQRAGEGAQHVLAGREVAAAGRDLAAQELAHPRDVVGDRLEGGGPARVDELGQRSRGHAAILPDPLVISLG